MFNLDNWLVTPQTHHGFSQPPCFWPFLTFSHIHLFSVWQNPIHLSNPISNTRFSVKTSLIAPPPPAAGPALPSLSSKSALGVPASLVFSQHRIPWDLLGGFRGFQNHTPWLQVQTLQLSSFETEGKWLSFLMGQGAHLIRFHLISLRLLGDASQSLRGGYR